MDSVHMTTDLYRLQLESMMREQNKKHGKTIEEIINFSDRSSIKAVKKSDRLSRFMTKINNFHNQTAKEEQKKLEKMAKQRLQALKLNDEEAYLKLLDHTKDTRITHLLEQTNQFLDSLALAVQSQQKEAQDNLAYSGRAIEPASVEPLDDEKREKLIIIMLLIELKKKSPSNLQYWLGVL